MKRETFICTILLLAACSASHAGGGMAADTRTAGATDGSNTAGAVDPKWDMRKPRDLGPAISYSGYREGQSPNTGVHPTEAQIVEDLQILAKHWTLIRMYGSGAYSEATLKVIREKGITLKVMLGAWLDKEPGNESSNATQIETAIRLANEYKDIVVAINVGNEALVNWTAHPVPVDRVIAYVRQVKSAVAVPVTVADNYAWWRDHGTALAREVDFLTIHTYPVWERKTIEDAMAYTIQNYEEVKRALPGKNIVIGEAGWPSYSTGNQHVPRAGNEARQKRYFEELTAWGKANKVTVFFFEAFDEPWKGTGTTEGHWGLLSVDRKAKLVVQDMFPELMPDGPTSPEYKDQPEHWGPNGVVAFREGLAKKLGHCGVNPHGPGILPGSVVEAPGAAGGTSLLFAHDGSDWGGLYMLCDSVDASTHKTMVMRMRIPDYVASLELKVEGPPSKAGSVNVVDYLKDKGADGWNTFAVPLSDLAGVDLKQVAIVGYWNPKASSGALTACEIQVDDIHFE